MKKKNWQIDNILEISQILSIHYKDLNNNQKEKIRIKLWIYQHGRCAICNSKIIASKGCLDHCHNTDLIRGLLCSQCNNGLGAFQDNKYFLVEAIRYITNKIYLEQKIKYIYEYDK